MGKHSVSDSIDIAGDTVQAPAVQDIYKLSETSLSCRLVGMLNSAGANCSKEQ